MSRAVFVSSCGEPFLDGLIYKLFKERWYEEADRFYIDINNNNHIPSKVIGEELSKLSQDPKVHIIYHPNGIGNGVPITEMTLISKEDVVLLLENDGFIFDSGYVDELFTKIEHGETDMIGSPRFSCGNEIGEASIVKYHDDYSGFGDRGPNFWPNFFFCKRSDLLKTDMDFGSHAWKKEEWCQPLNWFMHEDTMGDTFVWACIQLRALRLQSFAVPQHKADPYEVESKLSGDNNWREDQKPFHWIHGGSLSTSWGGYLSGVKPDVSIPIAKLEMETRCAFWKLASDTNSDYPIFNEQYANGIDKLIYSCNLDADNIGKKYTLYKNLLRI